MNNLKLKQIYYDPTNSASFAGERKLLEVTKNKIPRDKVIGWLETQDAYNKHKLTRKTFPRRPYSVNNIDDYWEVDLIDLKSIKEYNDNYTFVFVAIDVFSKMAWVEPMLNKSSSSAVMALKKILKRSKPRVPICVQCDKGREFTGKDFQKFLEKQDIKFRLVRSPDVKAAVVERFIRTLKERMWRLFTYSRNKRYVDSLQQLVDSYNRTYHTTIKTIPANVTLDNSSKVREILSDKLYSMKKRTPKYHVGDFVRISCEKASFQKGYKGGYSEEIFRISRILTQRFPIVYVVSDLSGEEIDGIFYTEELSRVRKGKTFNKLLTVKKILQVKGRGNEKRVLVSWKGLPDNFNTWLLHSKL